MKPSIIRAGIRTCITAAAIATVAGFAPATAGAVPGLPELPQKLAGKTVFLDPGHQGANHNQNVARPVSDGRGGSKPCQTTGMTTVNGIPEHTINWNVAQLVKTSLQGLGANVVLSRPDDTGWGGCIDERAAAANQSGADVAVSIHADSAPAEMRGFHLIVPALPIPDAKANEAQSGAGLAASQIMRDAYVKSGFPAATYAGADNGIMTRDDIAGPALTHVPDVFLEMGNGANPEDAALLESQEGQLRHAVAITTGIAAFLLGLTPGPAESDQVNVPEQAPLPQVPGQPSAVEPQTQPGTQPSTGTEQQPATVPQPSVVEPQVPGQPSAVEPQVPGQPSAVEPQTPSQPSVVEPQAPSQPSAVEPQTQPGTDQSTQPAPVPAYPAQPAGVEPQAAPQNPQPSAPSGQPQPGEQIQPAPAPAEVPVPAESNPAQPQAFPGQNDQPARVPVVRPIAEGIPYPVPANPNSVGAPGAPQVPAAAAKPQPTAPAAPGATAPGVNSPNTKPSPGGAKPSTPGGTDKSSPSEDASIKSLVQTAIQLLTPLAKMFGMDSQETGIASSMINLAYTLVSTLVSELVSPSN
ncbi:N-acetylmuramoyl-L-alanine amidase [Nocardia sp. NPDC050406]|uniref:N-acetylmuramoyl-L-alanine amidase n=1 Tax=Nocardia sp. NPDC050406 TaxID=3364318 RepID=UPI0037942845